MVRVHNSRIVLSVYNLCGVRCVHTGTTVGASSFVTIIIQRRLFQTSFQTLRG